MRSPRRVVAAAFALLTSMAMLPPPAAASYLAPATMVAPGARMADPCTSMAGERITRPGFPVFIVDSEGYRRGINHPDTYNRLFRNWDGIKDRYPLEICPERAPLSLDAQLLSAPGRPVFLFTNGEKHGITDGRFMDKYYFDWNKVQTVTVGVLDAIPEGTIWA